MVVIFQSCVWLRKGCPVMSCVIAECVNAVGNAGRSGIGVGGCGQAWQKGRPLPVSCCLAGERELGEGGQRGSGQVCCVPCLHTLWEAGMGQA